MKRLKAITTIIIVTIIGTGFGNTVNASGFFANNVFVQSVPTESRAVIAYDGKKETLFDSVTFNINPVVAWNFEWVMAVPSEPKVNLILDELLTKFDTISKKNLSKDNLLKKILYFDAYEEKETPASIYSRPVDFTKFEVFGPDKSLEDLEQYLAESGYIIPKTAKHILEDYHNKKWYFIAAEVNANHLQMDASESLTIPGAHTFPIKVEFDTDKIIYPLKLATVQTDYDAENIPLSYEYGTSSEQVLGAKDVKVDEMLSIQSKNKYPRIPLDYSYMKVELFVLSNKKVDANGFTTIYANKISSDKVDFSDFNKNKYFEPDKSETFLTRLVTYKPMLQLEDAEIVPSKNNKIVNDTPPAAVQYFKLGAILLFPVVLLFILFMKFKKSE